MDSDRADRRWSESSVRASDAVRARGARGDFFGGTVAALIAVPYGMALALAIGLRPEAGLYTSMIGGAVYGLLSRSPAVVSGLSATVVPILAALVKSHGVGAALAAGFLCGLFMTLIGALRLGRFVAYLPQSIVSAFTSGLGVIIVTSQLKPLLGVQPRPAGFDLGVVDDLWAVAGALGRGGPAVAPGRGAGGRGDAPAAALAEANPGLARRRGVGRGGRLPLPVLAAAGRGAPGQLPAARPAGPRLLGALGARPSGADARRAVLDQPTADRGRD